MTATATAPSTPSAPSGDRLERIRLDQLHESPLNPRKHFDPAALEQLKDSLLASGQLEPVLVRPMLPGTRPKGPASAGYELAAGHRRFRAAKLAVEKHADGARHRGLGELLAIVRDMDERTFIETLNVDNLQRDDLHPLEEAGGFKDLMTECGYDVAKIATRIGKSTRYVYDSLTLLKLIPAAKKLFVAGAFERGHAIILARLTSEQQKDAMGDLEDLVDSGEYAAHRVSLLFRPTTVDGEELELHDRIKPVSVREFQAAVDRHVRATPETIDPVLFPDTVQALTAAKEEDLKVIYITREYRVADDAKDDKTRTYGRESWKQADGERDDDGDPSQTCAWSRYGFVAAGPGRGEAFKVCINRDKCDVHWKKERAERARRAKSGTAGGGATGGRDSAAKQQERWEQERKESEAQRQRWAKAQPAVLEAVAAKVKTMPAGPSSELADAVLQACVRRGNKPHAGVPRGRTHEDLLRHAGFQLYVEEVSSLRPGYYDHARALKSIKALGVDAQKTVDQVAPEPKPEPKKAEKSQTSAKPKKAKKGKKR